MLSRLLRMASRHFEILSALDTGLALPCSASTTATIPPLVLPIILKVAASSAALTPGFFAPSISVCTCATVSRILSATVSAALMPSATPASSAAHCAAAVVRSTTMSQTLLELTQGGGFGGGGLFGPSVRVPGGATPCQPGARMPEPSSEVTVRPSADTVPVPLMTSMPEVWSKLRMLSLVPGAALKTFGKVICTGCVNAATPGAWIVMSKVCCNTPGGSMSLTSAGGTVAMPIFTLLRTWPSAPTAAPAGTVSVSCWRCASVRPGAADGVLAVITVFWVSLTFCSTSLATRGR